VTSEQGQAVDFAVLRLEALRAGVEQWKDAYAALLADFRILEAERDILLAEKKNLEKQ
jgi:hypothetical protein